MAEAKRTGPTTDIDAGPSLVRQLASNIDIETLLPQLRSGQYILTLEDAWGSRNVCRAKVCQLQNLGASDPRLFHFDKQIKCRYRVTLQGLISYKVNATHAYFDRRFFHVPCFEAMSPAVQRCLRLPPERVWRTSNDFDDPVLVTTTFHEAIVDWVRLGGKAYDAKRYHCMKPVLAAWREVAASRGLEWAMPVRPVSSHYVKGEPSTKRLSDVLVEVRCGPYPVPEDPVIRLIVPEHGAGDEMCRLVGMYKPGALARVQQKPESAESDVDEQPSSGEDSGLEEEPRLEEDSGPEEDFGLEEECDLEEMRDLQEEPDLTDKPLVGEGFGLDDDSGLEEERGLEDLAETDIAEEWSESDVLTPDDFFAVRNLTELVGALTADRNEGQDGANVSDAAGVERNGFQ